MPGLFDDVLGPKKPAAATPASGLFDDVLNPPPVHSSGRGRKPHEHTPTIQFIDPLDPESLRLQPSSRLGDAVTEDTWERMARVPLGSDPDLQFDGFQAQPNGSLVRVPVAEPWTPAARTTNPFEGARARVYDLLGSGIRGIANLGENLGDTLETALPISGLTPEQIANEQQLAPLFRASDFLRDAADEVGYAPAVGMPAVKEALYDPISGLGDLATKLGTTGRFALDQALTSTPDMAAAIAALPAYVLGRTQEIGERRVANDARTGEPTLGDLAAAAPAAALESTLERFATRGLGHAQADTVLGRIAAELGLQTGTETAEEVIANLGEALGTERGVDQTELGEAALGGALGGMTVGGAGALGGEAVRAARSSSEAVAAAKADFDAAIRQAPDQADALAAAAAARHGVTPDEILSTPDVPAPAADDLDVLLLRNVLGAEQAPPAPEAAGQPEPLGGPAPALQPDAEAQWRRPEPAAPPAPTPALPASSPVTAGASQTLAQQAEQPQAEARLFQRGNGRNNSSAQALELPDGTWRVRHRKAGQWQPWEARATFDPSPTFGYRETGMAGGKVNLPDVGAVPVRKTEQEQRERDYNPLLDMIASAGGITRADARRFGVDPAAMNQRRGIRPLFSDKGIPLDALRERLLDEGYLQPEDPNAPPQLDVNDVWDLVSRALSGEPVAPMNDPAYLEWQQRRNAASQQAGEETDADADPDNDLARWYDEASPDEPILAGDEAEALSIAELAERAALTGADEFDIAPFSGEAEAAYAARLWQTIQQQEAARGPDRQAEAGDLREGVSGREGRQAQSVQEGGFALEPEQPAEVRQEVAPPPRQPAAGLFGAPSTRDFIDDASRRRDAARDGRTGTGRTDMLAGDGELFAGPRPEQTGIESAEPARDARWRNRVAAAQQSFELSAQRGESAATWRAEHPGHAAVLQEADPEEVERFDVADSARQGEADAEALGLREAVREVLGDAADRVEFVRDHTGLPYRLRNGVERRLEQRGGKGQPAALYDTRTQRVYVFTGASNTPEKAAFHAAHEIAGHHGLRTLLGDKLDHALNLALQNPTVREVADGVAKQRNLRGDQRMLAAEEALADLAAAVRTGRYDQITATYGVIVPEGMQERVARAVENFLRRLRQLFDDLFGRHVFSDEDVRALLEAAWQAATGGPTISTLQPDGTATLDQAAFHGTPHKVDRFRLDRIGTGEGAQAFGWGMYFASRREIAESYRDKLTQANAPVSSMTINGQTVDPESPEGHGARLVFHNNKAEMKRLAKQMLADAKAGDPYTIETAEKQGLGAVEYYQRVADTINRLKKSDVKVARGNLYTVEVPEDSDLMDWDKPIDQQPPKVREVMERMLSDGAFDADSLVEWESAKPNNRTGQRFYRILVGSNSAKVLVRDPQQNASLLLNEAGIPGLRYLDGGSRASGDGSHNYVIWDEAAIGVPEDALDSIAPEQTNTPEFKAWFGDSKVVDADGAPLVVYHGTGGDFEVFENRPGRGAGGMSARHGFFFSASPVTASEYAEETPEFARNRAYDRARRAELRGDYDEALAISNEAESPEFTGGMSPNVLPVYLSIQNPKVVDFGGRGYNASSDNLTEIIREAKSDGHDGVILRNFDDAIRATDPADQFVIFRPEQIKSATANRGTFDPDSPSILESVDYTPEQTEALGKAGIRVERRTTLGRIRDNLREEWTKLRDAARDTDALKQATFDKFHGLRMAEAQMGLTDPEQSPYVAARMSAGIGSNMEGLMLYGAPKWDGGILAIDPNTVGLLDALKPVEGKVDDWLGWMVGRRAKLLKSQGRENNLSDTDIDALLSLAKGNEAAFQQAAVDYLKIKNSVLDVAEQAGLIDPVARAAWDHAEYIPFYRQEGDHAVGPGTKRGLSGQSSGIRTLKGGDQALADPLANIVRNFSKLLDAANKNRATLLAVDRLGGQFFKPAPREMQPATIPMDQVKRHLREQGVPDTTIDGMPPAALRGVQRMLSIVPPAGEDVVRVMREGKPEYYRVLDPLVLRALTAFKEPAKGVAIKPFIWFKRLLTTGVTTTAEFVGANFIRDSGSAWVISDDRFIPGWDSLKGVGNTLRNDPGTRDMMMAGATFLGGNFYDGNADAAAASLRRALRAKGLSNRDLEGFMGTVARSPLHLWDAWLKLSGAVENANRRAVYDAALRSGRTKTEAAYMARDLMDFSMQGDAQWVQFFSDVLPFFNARLQGMYKLGRRAGTTEGRRAIILRGGVLALASAALYAWNVAMHGDGYDDLEEWDKDAYWHIAPGTDHHVRIPKPFELGLIFGTGPERAMQAIRNATTGEGDKPGATWDALVRAFTGTLAMNPIPQAALPVVEQWANKRFFTGRAIENMGDDKLLPEARAEWYTSETAKAISDLVGNETGMSPKRIEHLWNGYTAGLGGYVLDSSDAVVRMLTDAPERPEMATKDWPILGRFLRGGSPGATKYTEQFYGALGEAEQIEQTIKQYTVAGRVDEAEKLERDNADILGERVPSKRAKGGFLFARPKALRKVRGELSTIREEIEDIALDRKLSDHDKRVKIDELTAKRNRLVKQAVTSNGLAPATGAMPRKPEAVGVNRGGRATPAPDILKGAKNAPRMVMVGDWSGLPREAAQAFDEGAEGVFDPNEQTVYVAMGMDEAHAKYVAYHEVAGHYGLQGALGDDYERVLNRARQNPTVEAIANALGSGAYKNRPNRLALTEEALSELAAARRTDDYSQIESLGVEIPRAAKPGVLGMLNRVAQMTKRTLADLTGEETAAYDDDQVYELLEDAWQYVER